MSQQIIRQPNGNYCIYDADNEIINYHNLKEEEILPLFLDSYKEMITKEVERVLHILKHSDKWPYKGRQTSYVKALLDHLGIKDVLGIDTKEDEAIFKAVQAEIEEYKKNPTEEFTKLVKALFPKSEWVYFNIVPVPDIQIFKKRVILEPETKVNVEVTYALLREWSTDALPHRKTTGKGTVISYHSDKDYYDILHDDDTVGFYSPWELTPHE